MSLYGKWIGLFACALLVAPLVKAQTAVAPVAVSNTAAVEISRDEADFVVTVRPQPVDIDRVDSALVFTNEGKDTARVYCVGRNANGRVVGRIRLKVPALGLRFAEASDLSNGRDFVGSAQCWTRGHVRPSAFLLAPGNLTDLPAKRADRDWRFSIRFPVVATY